MSLINDIIGQRSYEFVRDTVASILAVELARQSFITYDDTIDAEVYTERWRPVTITECRDVPVVNVSIANVSPENQTAIDRDDTVLIIIDAYKSDPASQTQGSDEISMSSVSRICGIIDGILSHPAYLKLGFTSPFIMRSKVTGIEFADSNRSESGGISMGRITLTVVCDQSEPTTTGQPIAGILTQVIVNETDKGYLYSCSGDCVAPPVTPRCLPVTVTDSDGVTTYEIDSGGTFECSVLTPFEPVIIHNSDDSFNYSANSGDNVLLPNILIELGNGDTEEFPSVKDIQLLDYYKILNDTGTRIPVNVLTDPTTQVQWNNVVDCSTSNGTITKIGPPGWYGGGSFIINTTSDFRLEFNYINAGDNGMVGISFADTDYNYPSIFAAIYNYGFGYQAYVGGSFAAPYNVLGTWPCKIERIGSSVNMYINNTLIHTINLPSSNQPQMVFDSSFYTTGSGVENILLTFL